MIGEVAPNLGVMPRSLEQAGLHELSVRPGQAAAVMVAQVLLQEGTLKISRTSRAPGRPDWPDLIGYYASLR
jgi:hypothetical protein